MTARYHRRAAVLAVLAGTSGVAACSGTAESRPEPKQLDTASIVLACASCHVAPAPAMASKQVWRTVMPRMYALAKQVRPELPPYEDVLGYFVARAPDRLDVRTADSLTAKGLAAAVDLPLAEDARQAEITCLEPLSSATGEPLVAYCDTDRRGVGIRSIRSQRDTAFIRDVGIPVFLDAVDVDRDGRMDLLVADIGSAPPEQTTRGRILWIPARAGATWGAPRELVTGLGRVVGAALRDLDGDRIPELVVAEFGADLSGGLHLYQVDQLAAPLTNRRTLDARSGAVKVALADIDADGRDDIVAAFAQQHEQVIVYRNEGASRFAARTIFAAPSPGWGMVGLEVVDFDHDGDLDVLSVNGDTLDTMELRPFHGVHLHRQTSDGFVTEQIGALPGAFALAVGDLDGDGDLDVAACAFIHPAALAPHASGTIRLLSAAWFEQANRGFVAHSIAVGEVDSISLAMHDFDRDGDLDLLIGKRTWTPTSVWTGRGDRTAMRWFENRARTAR